MLWSSECCGRDNPDKVLESACVSNVIVNRTIDRIDVLENKRLLSKIALRLLEE